MLDGDIHALLAYTASRHAETDWNTDIDTLPGQFGCTLTDADASRLNGSAVYVKRGQIQAARRSDIAHELAHKLARENGPCYEDIIRHRHRSVPHMAAHLERLTEHQQDVLLMPDETVRTVLGIAGVNARAVWILHQTAEVYVHEALRRTVHWDENGQMGGFIARKGRITHAYSYRWHMPCWIGDDVPDEYDGFDGECVSLFDVPGVAGLQIGLVVL